MRASRLLATFAAVAALVVGALVPVSGASASVASGLAGRDIKATLVGFSAGNIISDAVFTNKSTMTEAQIQTFFNSKVPKCLGGSDKYGPIVCLKDYKATSVNRPADAYCSGYTGATNESAARIIYRVAQSCNINPQVLIVMLQKEQGLVTHTWPSAWRYSKALGQGCPDGGVACDPNYVGFFHQIYGAARQMQIYMEGKWFTWYAPGKTWNILWHPPVEVSPGVWKDVCGSSPVYVANKATAALYYYTPYQPNAAALRAGYGEGDSCSAYGNRNFYNYFTDWFGPTQYALRAAIAKTWEALGGAGGSLGTPVGSEKSVAGNGGGFVQEFQRGTIWLKSGAAEAFAMGTGPLRNSYLAAGGPAGGWGWLAAAPRCGMVDSGCLATFQNGIVGYSPATGAALIPRTIAAEWNRVGAVVMGYPTAGARCGMVDSGCLQSFQRATVGYSPATGAVMMSSAVAAGWNRLGAVSLGYPSAPGIPAAQNGGGEQQQFSKGMLWASPHGAFMMGSGPLRDAYLASGGGAGAWGWPAGAARCGLAESGCLMVFQHGTVGYSPATGAVLIAPGAAAEWNRLGIAVLGYPSSPPNSVTGAQQFTKGAVFVAPTVTVTIPAGAFLTAYLASGGMKGSGGAPVARPRCGLVEDGCLLSSTNGTIAFSPKTGLIVLPHPIAAEWNRRGVAALGYPIAAANVAGAVTTQRFQKGTVRYDSATDTTTVL